MKINYLALGTACNYLPIILDISKFRRINQKKVK